MRLRTFFQHRRTWHVLVGAPLLLCVLLISGCSSQFIYNRLDTLAGWYFENLVSLNDGQRTELRAWLERTLAWHRESELLRYAAFVSDVSATLSKPSSREVYDSMRQRLQALIDSLVAKTAPEASRLLLRLSPEQVDELLENLAEKTRKSTKENAEAVADNEWHPEQTKNFIRQMKRWTGSVNAEQKAMIAAAIAQLEPTHEDWAQSQHAWREALRDALARHRVSEDDTPPAPVLALLEDPNRHWTRAYSEKIERNRQRYLQLLMKLDASLSSEQREHLRTELDKLAEQFTRLARG